MKNTYLQRGILMGIAAFLINGPAYAAGDGDPFLVKMIFDELETGLGSDDSSGFEIQAWAGRDLHKFWLKAEGEYQNSDEKEAEVQALYSRAIAPYWDAQVGVRTDIEPSPSRTWAVLGIQGLAPYYFEIDAALFIGEQGRAAARLKAEYEMLITQRLILSPQAKVNFYGKNDAEVGIGSGLSDFSAGLRLRYEFKREFAPYIGIEWAKKFGNTADFARNQGEKTHGAQFVVGLRAWF